MVLNQAEQNGYWIILLTENQNEYNWSWSVPVLVQFVNFIVWKDSYTRV